jgi:hypothetical protein
MTNQSNKKTSSIKRKYPKNISYNIDLTINENGLTIGQTVNTYNDDSETSFKATPTKRKASREDLSKDINYQNRINNKSIHAKTHFKFHNNKKGNNEYDLNNQRQKVC